MLESDGAAFSPKATKVTEGIQARSTYNMPAAISSGGATTQGKGSTLSSGTEPVGPKP